MESSHMNTTMGGFDHDGAEPFKIHASNFPDGSSEDTVHEFFSEYGRVTKVHFKGRYAFVCFDSQDAVDRLLELRTVSYKGNPIDVQLPKPRESRPGEGRCHYCGGEGHWKRECPKQRNRDNRGYDGPDRSHHSDPRGRGDYRDSRGSGDYRDSRGSGDYRDPRGRNDYPDSRGRNDYPDSRGRNDYPDSRGRNDYPDSRGRTDYPDSRGRGDYVESRGRGDYPDSRGRGDYSDPRSRSGYANDHARTQYSPPRASYGRGSYDSYSSSAPSAGNQGPSSSSSSSYHGSQPTSNYYGSSTSSYAHNSSGNAAPISSSSNALATSSGAYGGAAYGDDPRRRDRERDRERERERDYPRAPPVQSHRSEYDAHPSDRYRDSRPPAVYGDQPRRDNRAPSSGYDYDPRYAADRRPAPSYPPRDADSRDRRH
eukprot:TRINITY_DN1673_c0_g1_i2.p1 TRINITY_DN1673_c0_g1~~TRINITY_DN1673_c0_g1_i2.p1  ORF type:complete len:426 (-),score=52.51 TRINITY_DN1673_c0_g1_i2:865-2142(-)